MPEPVVLILGCGAGGVVVAREARRLLPAPFRVVVIDREAEASRAPSYLWLMTGERRPEAIRRARGRLARKGIEFVKGEVRHIDLANRYVRADSREFRYDYLVLALGAEASLEFTPGLAESAHAFHTSEAAERLAASLRYFAGGRVVVAQAEENCGPPTAAYEAAMLLEHFFHARRIRQKVELQVFVPEAMPFALAGPQTSDGILGLLAHKGIELHGETHVVSADAQRREAVFRDETRQPFELLIALPRKRLPGVVKDAGFAAEDGWLRVNPATLETSQSNVFALGDLVSLPLPDGGRLPRLAPLVEEQGRHVAAQIAYRAAGGPYPDPLSGRVRHFVEVGGGAAALVEGDFLAPRRQILFRQPSLVWHWANLAQERYWLWRWY